MAQKFSNNATTTLSGGIAEGTTVLTVAGGTGDLFPTVDNGDPSEYLMCTLENATGTFEIVRVDGRNGDQFFIQRGQEQTTPAAFVDGDRFELRLTAAAINTFIQRDGDAIDGGSF